MVREGVKMRYPNTFPSKIVNFPWKRYWNINYFMRSAIFGGFPLACLVLRPLSNFMHTDENKRHWKEVRAHYFVSHYDLPKDPLADS